MPPKPGRVNKEFGDVQAKNYDGVAVSYFDQNNIFLWKMVIDGQGPFTGGKFVVEVNMEEYPFKCPKIKFLTKAYHPNIAADGQICLAAIEGNWVPTKTASDVLDFILTTFRAPTDENAQDMEIANHWKTNRTTWEAKAAEWTQMYAK